MDAFETEARQYRDAIFSTISRRTGDAVLAEEVTQEAMARVLARLHQSDIEDPARLLNFAYRVAANVLRERRRQDARFHGDPEVMDGVESPSPDQFECLARSEENRRMWQALERIGNDGYREILIRFYLRQEEKTQICATLDLSPRQFANRLDRAKKAFRAEYHELTGPHVRGSLE
jgi:RNA polymerase sigma factor (sigma-70 family)